MTTAGSPAPAFARCIDLLRRGDPQAQTALGELFSRHPDDAAGWEQLGAVLAGAGKTDAALVCFNRAAAVAPNHALAMRRGLLLRDGGRPAEAVVAFAEAVRLAPRAVRAHFLLGLCAQDLHDHATAATAYRAALAIDPTLAEAAVNLGIVLQDQGDLDAAKRSYGAAVRTRADTFGRVAQALSTAPRGELWLDLAALRRALAG